MKNDLNENLDHTVIVDYLITLCSSIFRCLDCPTNRQGEKFASLWRKANYFLRKIRFYFSKLSSSLKHQLLL